MGEAVREKSAQSEEDAVPIIEKESRRERNKRVKLERIVSSARTLFRTKGYEETRTQDIADGADVGSGTLFLYAKSKEDLLVLVFMDEMYELIDNIFQTIPENTPLLAQAMEVFGRMIDYHNRDFATAGKLIRELTFLQNPERRDEVFSIQKTISRNIARLVEIAQQRGEIREDVDSLIAARCIFAIYSSQMTFWLGGFFSEAEFRQMLQKLLSQLVDGMRT